MARRTKPDIEGRLNGILFLLALWMGAFGISFWAFLARQEPQIGLTNMQMALGWQGVAGLIAFAIWGIGWGLPKGHGVRRLSAVPMGMALAIAGLGIFGLF